MLPDDDADGELIEYPDPPLPRTATTAPPGSGAKMDVLTTRLRRGEQLFHQGDADEARNPVPFVDGHARPGQVVPGCYRRRGRA